MACEACRVKFSFFSRKKQCRDCLRYYCSYCLIKRLDKVLSCYSCTLLSQRPLTRSQIVKICSRDLRKYLLAKKIPINGCIEKEDLIELLLIYANNASTESAENTNRANINQLASVNQFQAPNEFQARAQETDSGRFTRKTETNSRTNFSSNHTTGPFDSDQGNSHTREETLTNPVKLSDINTLADLNRMTVKQLKNLLSANRVNYKGCIEKHELLDRASRLWKEHEQSRISKMRFDEDIPDENLCKICWDEPIECVILECGHMVCCLNCGKQLSECPICKQYIVRVVRFFKA